MKEIYVDGTIAKDFKRFFRTYENINLKQNVYVLYDEKPDVIEKNSTILVNGDNRELLKSLAGTESTVITCGMSGISTFTFSSVNESECVLCLQRTVVSFDGQLMQPQEIPVSFEGNNTEPDRMILILAFAFLTHKDIM